MASQRLENIRKLYDNRAPSYDQEGSFHAKQASDFIKWMSLESGYRVLDLACGTGAITVPASQAVGSSGIAIGVDISSTSLKIARAKAEKAGAPAKFFEHDITRLEELQDVGIEENSFDIITCASAFMLVENPDSAVKAWSRLLKKGGRIIIDVPTRDSTLPALLLERIATQMGMEVAYKRERLETMAKLTRPLKDAGLDMTSCFVADHYAEPEVLDAAHATEILEDTLKQVNNTFTIWYKDLARPENLPMVRELFTRELNNIVDETGKVKSYFNFNIAIGQKT